MKKCFEEQKAIREENNGLIEKAKSINSIIAPVKDELKSLKSKRDAISSFCGNYSKLSNLDADLKRVKERLVFGSISPAEEKKLFIEKKKLEELRPYLA